MINILQLAGDECEPSHGSMKLTAARNESLVYQKHARQCAMIRQLGLKLSG